jgi:uncharacterized membrane protein YeaQ/YmgE (transglycosylase-associated protein family)
MDSYSPTVGIAGGCLARPGGPRTAQRYAKQEAAMSLIVTIVVGLIIGALAKLIMPGKDPGGIIVTILLGIAGAFLGSLLGQAMGLYAQGQAAGWIMSVIGALVLLFLYRMFTKSSATR